MVTMLRSAAAACFTLVAAAWAMPMARADHQPVLFVDPATGTPLEVREGEWGLYRPGAPPRHVYPLAPPVELPPAPAFFPATGAVPQVGRREYDPPARRRARRAGDTTFRRSWSAASDPVPADSGAASGPRELILAPQVGAPWGQEGLPPQPFMGRGRRLR